MTNFQNIEYSYTLPQSQIANSPASPRDSSKLFVYNTATGQITHTLFRHINEYLPKNSALFLNNTKVLPVRIHAIRYSGKIVELLVMQNLVKNDEFIYATCSKKLLPNEYVTLLNEKSELTQYSLHAQDCEEKIFKLLLKHSASHIPHDPYKYKTNKQSFEQLRPLNMTHFLMKHGETPLPGYIQNCKLDEKKSRTKYQTIFAKQNVSNNHVYGSAAAPTASLHFTNRVFKSLQKMHVSKHFLTHHIGLGTFAPVLPEYIEQKKLFEEYYSIPKTTVKALKECKKDNVNVTAVGTTAVRALESFGKNKKSISSTDLFILPPFKFKVVNQLITNFHLPNTSLMMLVESFLRDKKAKHSLKELYEIAIENQYRFYSFGDAMLIL